MAATISISDHYKSYPPNPAPFIRLYRIQIIINQQKLEDLIETVSHLWAEPLQSFPFFFTHYP